MWPLLLRFAPYLLGAGAVLGAYFWAYGKGYSTAETEYKLTIAQMEAAQNQYAITMGARLNRALARKHTSEAEIAEKLSEIATPSGSCDSPEWLLSHNAVVRALRDS